SQMPMSPELIRDYRRRINESQKAAALPPSGHRPRGVSDAIRVSLSSEQQPITLSTSPGAVSVVAFYDSTGQAWPVASFVVGRGDAFQVYALQQGSNQLAISPKVAHGYTNLAVSLVEEDRPFIINLETSEEQTHMRRDVTINGYGPKAKVSPSTPR